MADLEVILKELQVIGFYEENRDTQGTIKEEIWKMNARLGDEDLRNAEERTQNIDEVIAEKFEGTGKDGGDGETN